MKKSFSFLATGALLAVGLGLANSQPVQASETTVGHVHGGEVVVHNGWGSKVTGQKLSDGSDWVVYKSVHDANGKAWYNVGANQYVPDTSMWLQNYYSVPMIDLHQYAKDSRNVVIVMENYGGQLWSGYGDQAKKADRVLDMGSAWEATRRVYADGQYWYRVGKNQYLKQADVLLAHTWHNQATDSTTLGNTTGPTTNNNQIPNTDQNTNTNQVTPDPTPTYPTTPVVPTTPTDPNTGTPSTGQHESGNTNQTPSGSLIGQQSENDVIINVAKQYENSKDKGMVTVRIVDSTAYPLPSMNYYVVGNVGDHYTINLPASFEYRENTMVPHDGQTTITGVIEHPGVQSQISVQYDQVHEQKMDTSTLQSMAYELMDNYRASKGLPAMAHSPQLQAKAQMNAEAITNGNYHGNHTDISTAMNIIKTTGNREVSYQDLEFTFNNDWLIADILASLADSTRSSSYGVGVVFDSDQNAYRFDWVESF